MFRFLDLSIIGLLGRPDKQNGQHVLERRVQERTLQSSLEVFIGRYPVLPAYQFAAIMYAN